MESALLFMATPPVRPLVHSRFSGTSTLSAQQSGQQVPASVGLTYLKGGLQSIALHAMPSQVSTEPPAPGEYTGYPVPAPTTPATRSKAVRALDLTAIFFVEEQERVRTRAGKVA